eukprot:gb/GEZN01003486.1/.p1 GENE.gb/GEZN01003486.1/~~gb/GEZN01003486.1/.p1  ORF type:complete len:669 (-),score=114.98 gb/GEZN01003486.1/:21-2027(-)
MDSEGDVPAPGTYVPSLDTGLAKNMTQRTDLVFEQIRHGLYLIKKYAQLLKTIAEGQKGAAQNQVKAMKHIESRKAKLYQDGMETYVDVFLRLNDYLSQTTAEEIKFTNAVINQIAQPLLDFYKRGEKRRKQLMLEDARLQNTWALIHSTVRKERDDCMKAWQALKIITTEAKNSTSGKKKSETAQVAKMRLKTQRLFQQYNESLTQNNSKLRKLQRNEVPKLLLELERMEQARLKVFLEASQKYTELKAKQVAKLGKVTEDLQRAFVRPKFEPALERFVNVCAEKSGPLQPPQMLSFDLPLQPELLTDAAELEAALDRDLTPDDKPPKVSRRISFFPGARGALNIAGSASSNSTLDLKTEEAAVSDDEGEADKLPVMTAEELRTVIVCRASYDLNSGDPADLSFVKGQFMRVVSKNEEDPNDKTVSLTEDNEDTDLWWHAYLLAGYGSSFWREHVLGLVPSNYIMQVHMTVQIDLRPFLEYPSCIKAFSEFLASEYSAENINFWLAVQDFHRLVIELEDKSPKTLPPKTPRKPDGTSLRGLKLGQGGLAARKAPTSRGAPPAAPGDRQKKEKGDDPLLARCREIVRDFISNEADQQVNIVGSSREQIQEGLRGNNVSADIFDAAQQEVLAMMRRDSWGRFKKTDQFKSLVASYKDISLEVFKRRVVD